MAPVDRELTEFDLKVTGQLPPELDGVYVRNGPNPVTPPNPEKYHWFAGTGMVHGLRLGNGKAMVSQSLGSSPMLPSARRTPTNPWQMTAGFSANLNIVAHAGQLLACVDGAPS